jgi:hypothetical protein
MSCPWWDNDDDGSPEHRVHVSNLPWRADERSLKDAFADYDPIYADVSGFSVDACSIRCFCSCISSVSCRQVLAKHCILDLDGICACLLVAF